MPELLSLAGATPPPWRRFLDQRFPDPKRRELLRSALQRTLNRDFNRRTVIYVVGPTACGKSALIQIVARTCHAAGIPSSHAGFTHAFGEEPAYGVKGELLTPTEPAQLPMIIWAARQDEVEAPKKIVPQEGHEAIFVDLSMPPVERTRDFSRSVGTLEVLTWIAERPA